MMRLLVSKFTYMLLVDPHHPSVTVSAVFTYICVCVYIVGVS